MRIGIIGNGFVGRATKIFAKNYFAKDENDTTERYEVLPDTASTPAKPNSIRTYSASLSDVNTARPPPAVSVGEGGWPPPFFKRLLFKPIEVYIYDIRPEACQPPGMTLEKLDSECDLVFLCLPTPLNHDGSCYTKILEDTIARCSNPYKVIRSTIPVGFAAKHGCYFMPEFLTEANWENDFRSTKEWVVGLPTTSQMAISHGQSSNEENDKLIAQKFSEIQHSEFKMRMNKLIKRSHKNTAIDSQSIIYCDTNEAEMLKLMKNCFLSAKVGLMNEFYDFCGATRTDYNTVTGLAKKDQRMGTSHFQVPGPDGRRGFGGTCFPKDTHSLYCQMNARGVHTQIYPAILARNDTIDRAEREWSRDVWRTTIPLPTPESKIVVVFSDTAPSCANYIADVIRTNLSKNNVVIEVVRCTNSADSSSSSSSSIGSIVSTMTHKNLLIKHHYNTSAPLFFPRVDECYYTPHSSNTAYETMREVSCVIDLWNNHKEMTLYVIKSQLNQIQSEDHPPYDSNRANNNESDTEEFESDDNAYPGYLTSLDYCNIIEEYYHSKFSKGETLMGRKLVVLF
jgi:UDPglucose 6-dehydrogenase